MTTPKAWKIHAHSAPGPKTCGRCAGIFVPETVNSAPFAPDSTGQHPGEPLCDTCAAHLDGPLYDRMLAMRASRPRPLHLLADGTYAIGDEPDVDLPDDPHPDPKEHDRRNAEFFAEARRRREEAL